MKSETWKITGEDGVTNFLYIDTVSRGSIEYVEIEVGLMRDLLTQIGFEKVE